MQQKKTLLALHFKRKSYLRFSFKFTSKTVLCALEHIFNEVKNGISSKARCSWDIIVKTSVCHYLSILLYIFVSSEIFKISVKTFENNRKNSENIAKMKLEQNFNSLLYNHLVYVCAKERDFDNFMISLPDKTENAL